MEEYNDFLVLRFSLVEEAKRTSKPAPLPNPKARMVSITLEGDREFTSHGVRYAFAGFSLVEPTTTHIFPEDRYWSGKVAKLRKAHVGKKIPGDIVEHEEDDWVPLIAIFDIEGQYIFVQKDWRFGTNLQIEKAIQTGLREPILATYNHRIFVEAKTTKESFWALVNSHTKIYRLELKLISPNILETNVKARDALAALKDMYGQDEVSIKLQNDSGSLRLSEEALGDYIDYTAEGEGRWSLTTEGDFGGKKKHSSEGVATIMKLLVSIEQEASSERELELEAEAPTPDDQNNSRLTAEVHAKISELIRQPKDD